VLAQHLFHEGGDAVKCGSYLFGDADFEHYIHRMVAGGRPVEVVRMKITEAGRQAINSGR